MKIVWEVTEREVSLLKLRKPFLTQSFDEWAEGRLCAEVTVRNISIQNNEISLISSRGMRKYER